MLRCPKNYKRLPRTFAKPQSRFLHFMFSIACCHFSYVDQPVSTGNDLILLSRHLVKIYSVRWFVSLIFFTSYSRRATCLTSPSFMGFEFSPKKLLLMQEVRLRTLICVYLSHVTPQMTWTMNQFGYKDLSILSWFQVIRATEQSKIGEHGPKMIHLRSLDVWPESRPIWMVKPVFFVNIDTCTAWNVRLNEGIAWSRKGYPIYKNIFENV